MLIVQKYGGSSLADEARIHRAARRVAEQVRLGHKVVVVVSAQGDTTDALLAKVPAVSSSPPARELDAYLSAGELMSAALMAMALQAQGIPAVSLTGWQAGLMTDSDHGDARVRGLRGNRIRQELEQGRTAVVTGFQGVSAEGDITTLGRGGSDTTAVALAAFLGADRCMIYTDVEGVYDRDPRKHPNAVRYERIGYDAMLALAQQGAQVLHDRCVELARRYQVPVQVLSSFRPGSGTMVTNE
ncbi:MAG: aspartate kinase [Oscillospiraceae bacterium]|nr:aspartate kinase [Oscillospiraceae bacterium]